MMTERSRSISSLAKRDCVKMSASRSSDNGTCSAQDLGVVAGVLLAGERVQHTTDGVHLFRDLGRRAAFRALEEEVLQEVRDARLVLRS